MSGKLKKLFNPDQIRRIGEGGKCQWSKETVQDALRLRYTCGSGYQNVLKAGFPYPSESTLFRRIRSITFKPGILYDTINMLRAKADCLNNFERHVGIVFENGNST